MKKSLQHTLNKEISLQGIGLHSGCWVTLKLIPAAENTGIHFIRTDLKRGENVIPARWDYVVDTTLCTVIGNRTGASVGTIEHLMSALRGCGIDNLIIEVDGPEVPAMDGSAMPFVRMIDEAGVRAQSAPRRAIKVLKPVSVEFEGKNVILEPASESVFAGEIAFDHAQIGRQRYETRLVNGNFRHDIADARTFGFLHEVEYMRAQGLALGGSLENAIVIDKNGVMNPEGLRSHDEFIRHKLLDAIGDLYLAGAPIIGRYDGLKAGHAINNALLQALFANAENWEYVEMTSDETAMISGRKTKALEDTLLVA